MQFVHNLHPGISLIKAAFGHNDLTTDNTFYWLDDDKLHMGLSHGVHKNVFFGQSPVASWCLLHHLGPGWFE